MLSNNNKKKKKIPKAGLNFWTIGVSEYWLGEQWHGGPTVFSVVDFVEYRVNHLFQPEENLEVKGKLCCVGLLKKE